MRMVKPKVGPGRSQWNAGGWFGAILAGTAMIVGGLTFASQSMAVATVWLACYAIAVVSGIFMWTRRKSLTPYPAMQGLRLVVGVASAIAILFTFFTRLELSTGFNATPEKVFLVLLIVPALMLGSHLLERRPT
jgi:uncharacterized membrane protein (DUF373 family)